MGANQATEIAKLESEVKRLAALVMEYQQVVSRIENTCQRHNGPHVNTGAHALAASVLAMIAGTRGGS